MGSPILWNLLKLRFYLLSVYFLITILSFCTPSVCLFSPLFIHSFTWHLLVIHMKKKKNLWLQGVGADANQTQTQTHWESIAARLTFRWGGHSRALLGVPALVLMKCLVEPPACQNRCRSHGGDMRTMRKIWGVITIAVRAQRGAGKTSQMRLRETLQRLYKLGCSCLRQTKNLKVFFGGKATWRKAWRPGS